MIYEEPSKRVMDTYTTYIALKQHFTVDKYDFFKTRDGKSIRASVAAFKKRNDKELFVRLSEKKEVKSLMLANFLLDTNCYVGYFVDQYEEAYDIYTEWRYRIESLSYVFQQDLRRMDANFKNNVIVNKNQHPNLIKLYISGDVCLETVVIINGLTKCFSRWDEEISDTIIYPRINSLVKNYTPFLKYDRDKMKDIVRNEFIHTR